MANFNHDPTSPAQREQIPSPLQNFIFKSKSRLLQIRRALENQTGKRISKHGFAANIPDEAFILGESVTPLWSSPNDSAQEQAWTLGKIQNLRVAARKLHRLSIPAGEAFSFWKELGRIRKACGYVMGREIRQGCVIPTLGGGICQLSNALYDAALKSGFEIIERHGHSVVIPGSLAERGRDATVYWNYVDFRFKSAGDFTLEVYLTAQDLVVRFRGDPRAQVSTQAELDSPAATSTASETRNLNDCYTCGEESCFRSARKTQPAHFGKTAFLLDAYWPEYQDYLRHESQPRDLVLLPFNPQVWRRKNSGWNPQVLDQTRYATVVALQRALALRQLPAQGGALQKTLLKYDRKLAESYLRRLDFSVRHVVVAHNLLNFLWSQGALAGRSFSVLMQRLPSRVLQERLDSALEKNPRSATLGDFRIPSEAMDLEDAALNAAEKIVTPHREIAELFSGRALHLDWKIPEPDPRISSGEDVLFAPITLGRKGAYEMRQAARELELPILVNERNLEDPDFWGEVRHRKVSLSQGLRLKAVVFPCHVENQPRNLLRYVAAGIPVLATAACGVEGLPGVATIPAGDPDALKSAIQKLIKT